MTKVLDEAGLTGAVQATLVADAAIMTGAAGCTNGARSNMLLADDRVDIGSATKTLIATASLRLLDAGRLTLDATVSELPPDIVLKHQWSTSNRVRVRHLLDHTAGLDDLRIWQFFSALAPAGLPVPSFIRSAKIATIEVRAAEPVRKVNTALLLRVGRHLTAMLGLPLRLD